MVLGYGEQGRKEDEQGDMEYSSASVKIGNKKPRVAKQGFGGWGNRIVWKVSL